MFIAAIMPEVIHPQIYKAYDIRGIYPDEVNKHSLAPVVWACAHIFDSGKVVIAHDGRHGSAELATFCAEEIKKQAVEQGKSFEVVAVGLATTPMYYFLVNDEGATGGMMITASHNPKEYNGVKVVGKGAETISGEELKRIIQKQS